MKRRPLDERHSATDEAVFRSARKVLYVYFLSVVPATCRCLKGRALEFFQGVVVALGLSEEKESI